MNYELVVYSTSTLLDASTVLTSFQASIAFSAMDLRTRVLRLLVF